MNLLVVLIALGLRQAGIGRDFSAGFGRLVRRWRDGLAARSVREGWNGAVTLGFIVLPPFLLVLAVVVALHGVFYGLPLSAVALLVMLPVLLDRNGPGVLAREQEAWFAADEKSRNLLADADPRAVEAAAALELTRARKELLAEQLREVFAPLFWFLLLTPVAAVAYFFLRVAAEPGQQPSAEAARKLLYYADWPVARVLALSFALAGDFVATWQLWRRQALDRELDALVLLDESAEAAEQVDLHLTPDMLPGAVLTNALAAVAALLHRALVIWVVLLALHTLWP
jgi:membrane protein required for beta-lactamase induction